MAWNWWTLTIRGLVAILFGVFTFFWPAVTLTVLALLFGAYALVDGIFNVVSAVRGGPDQERWWVILLQGVISLGAGLLTAFWPAITVLALIYVLAAWAILTGLLELAAAVKLRQYITGEWLLALAGVASVVFGLLLIVQPFAGAIVVAWWIGAYALIFGAILIGLSFRLRAWSRSVEPQRG